MDELTDQQLISEYLAGNEACFSELVERHLALVLNFINTMVNNRVIAEELTQEVFLKIWRHLKKYNPEHKFTTWALTIAKNTTIDYLRKQKIKTWDIQSLDDETDGSTDLASPEPLPDELFLRQELRLEVNQLIHELTPFEQTIVNMYYHEQLTFEEIADILDKSVNTVKSCHRRLLIKLRARL
jgi:RNA polymerase sigma-70 factor (ECF subfamily)